MVVKNTLMMYLFKRMYKKKCPTIIKETWQNQSCPLQNAQVMSAGNGAAVLENP
jgi:hypothetical protein